METPAEEILSLGLWLKCYSVSKISKKKKKRESKKFMEKPNSPDFSILGKLGRKYKALVAVFTIGEWSSEGERDDVSYDDQVRQLQ